MQPSGSHVCKGIWQIPHRQPGRFLMLRPIMPAQHCIPKVVCGLVTTSSPHMYELMRLSCVQGYLSDNTQATWQAPDAAANQACPALHSEGGMWIGYHLVTSHV